MSFSGGRRFESCLGNWFLCLVFNFGVNSGMNRQGKIKGRIGWLDCGSVSFEDAAVKVAEHAQVGADKVTVVVRDQELPDTEFELTVESVRAYRVTGLRGEE